MQQQPGDDDVPTLAPRGGPGRAHGDGEQRQRRRRNGEPNS